MFKKIYDVLIKIVTSAWKWMKPLMSNKTFCTILSVLVVAALKPLGVDVHIEVVRDILQSVGMDADPATIVVSIIGTILGTGTMFANDKLKDVKNDYSDLIKRVPGETVPGSANRLRQEFLDDPPKGREETVEMLKNVQ